MNVLLDIAKLGEGYQHTSHRTGIFRVVQSLANQLVEANECRMTLCASRDTWAAMAYAASAPGLRAVPFPSTLHRRLLFKQLVRVHAAHKEAAPRKRLPLKAARGVLNRVCRAARIPAAPLDPRSVANADLYHSTFYGIPEQARRIKSLRKLLTVYDLIPVFHPAYFPNGYAGVFEQQMRSLDPEDWALCISQATKNDLCNFLGRGSERTVVTRLAADAALFYPCHNEERMRQVRQKYDVPDAPYLLSLSTLEPRKNMGHVVKNFIRMIHEQNISELNLVLTGAKGWSYDQLFEGMSELGSLKNRVIVTGRVEDEDLAALYSGAFCFTYMSLYEGFGLPPLEAMQCGVPVITSDTSSLPEVVGDAGIMLDPHDSDGLCQSLLDVYQNASLRQEMSRKSLERAKLFSWKRCANETVQVYTQAFSA